MNKPARATDPARAPQPVLALPDLMTPGPLTGLRLWGEMNRAMSSTLPATLMIAASPFFWAPPLWIGALMAARSRPRRR